MNEDIILGGLAILFTGMAVLVPILGFTLRFAIKPVIDTWAQVQRERSSNDQTILLERQINMLEAELQQVQHTLRAVTDAQDFQRQLTDRAPGPVERGDW